MKELLILRHAKSSWKDASLSDHERPLKKRGRKAAPRMGRLLAAEGLVPDAVLSSTAVRARGTARRAAEAAGFEGEIELREALYHASPDGILREVAGVPDAAERLLVVGHNPGMESLVARLAGMHYRFPTAALAHFRLDADRWADVPSARAHLAGFWLPRELEDGDEA